MIQTTRELALSIARVKRIKDLLFKEGFIADDRSLQPGATMKREDGMNVIILGSAVTFWREFKAGSRERMQCDTCTDEAELPRFSSSQYWIETFGQEEPS